MKKIRIISSFQRSEPMKNRLVKVVHQKRRQTWVAIVIYKFNQYYSISRIKYKLWSFKSCSLTDLKPRNLSKSFTWSSKFKPSISKISGKTLLLQFKLFILESWPTTLRDFLTWRKWQATSSTHSRTLKTLLNSFGRSLRYLIIMRAMIRIVMLSIFSKMMRCFSISNPIRTRPIILMKRRNSQ